MQLKRKIKRIKSETGTGKTVELAVEDALSRLGASDEEIETKVLEVPTSGFMGIGAKNAKVEVTLLRPESFEDIAKNFLDGILATMNLEPECEYTYDQEKRNLFINMNIPQTGALIGKHGQTMDALQYLTGLVVNRYSDEYIRVILDINSYREKRKKTLEKLADRLANRVLRYGDPIELEPMNPYERRIIHAYLQNKEGVTTYSLGEGMDRHLVIEYEQTEEESRGFCD